MDVVVLDDGDEVDMVVLDDGDEVDVAALAYHGIHNHVMEEVDMVVGLDAGADDVESSEDGHEIWTSVDALHMVAKALEASLGAADSVKLAWRPTMTSEISEVAVAQTLFKLVDTLDDDDDVQTVWGNYDIPDEIMEKLG